MVSNVNITRVILAYTNAKEIVTSRLLGDLKYKTLKMDLGFKPV
jgi:hypothetical protein